LSDYAKGVLESCQPLIAAARKEGVHVVIDPKGRDYSKYRGATLVTPNQKEFVEIAGEYSNQDEMVHKAEAILRRYGIDSLLITRGADGMTLVRTDQKCVHIPSQAQAVFDVTGAGDTVVAVTAALLAGGWDLEKAVRTANQAAAVAVSRVGSAIVKWSEIAGTDQYLPRKQILSLEEAKDLVSSWRATNQRICMTNGCFDLLHKGHVELLERTKGMGDKLIVAINSDRSVKELKGSMRPITNQVDRAMILLALEAVDGVIIFDELTPIEIYRELLPDVLCKGSDYAVENIVGAKEVCEAGGRVEVISLVKGHSTTGIIEKTRQMDENSRTEQA